MAGFAEIDRRIAKAIAEFGNGILMVGAADDDPPFCYTIGNQARGLPELLTVGMADGWHLNCLSEIMRKRERAFDHGEIVDLGGARPVKVIEAGAIARAEYTIQAGRYFRSETYRVQQVLIPDKQGRFPGDPECAAPYALQPILEAA